MVAVSRSEPARNMAARMAANLPGGGGGSTDHPYTLHGFAPTRRNVEQGQDVQFIADVENTANDARELQMFVKLDGDVVATENKVIEANERRDVAQTASYSDLLNAVGNTGDYTLSVEAYWVSGKVSLYKTWGTMTLVGDDSGGDDPGGDDPPTTTPEIPTQYLLAGGGAFFFLLLLVLAA